MRAALFRPGPCRRHLQAGASLVEFALVAPAFLLLLFGIVEFALMFWTTLTMQHAVREGARYAVSGQNDLDPDPDAAKRQRHRAVLTKIREDAMGLYDLATPTVATAINGGPFRVYGDAGQFHDGMFGGPGDIVVLRLDCVWPPATPLVKPFFAASGGAYRFSVAATMRNEAF